jgi:hypothetical protein
VLNPAGPISFGAIAPTRRRSAAHVRQVGVMNARTTLWPLNVVGVTTSRSPASANCGATAPIGMPGDRRW